MAANSETQPVSFASEFFLYVFQISHAKLFNYEIERQRGGGNGGTTGSNLSFFSTTFSVPRLGVFIRYLSFASFKCRPDVRELMQRGMRETTLMIREFSSRHDRPPPSFFFQRAPAHMRVCVCVCGLSAMRPNVQLCDTLRQRLPPLMLTFVNRVFFVQWIRVFSAYFDVMPRL